MLPCCDCKSRISTEYAVNFVIKKTLGLEFRLDLFELIGVVDLGMR